MAYTSGRIFAGQKTGIDTNASQLDTATTNIREVIVQSDPANTTNLRVGDVNGQFVTLTPGQAITIPIISMRLIYVKLIARGAGTTAVMTVFGITGAATSSVGVNLTTTNIQNNSNISGFLVYQV